MATDLSLLRLRELLEWMDDHCNPRCILPASNAEFPDFNPIKVKQWLNEWGFHNRLAAKEAITGAEVLCKRNGLDDAADYFGTAYDEVERRWKAVFFSYRCDTGDAEPDLLLIAITDIGRYASSLQDKLLGYVRSLVEAGSLLQSVERAAGGCSEQFGTGSQLPLDLISFDDVAKLLGHTSKKRLQNEVGEWRKAGHKITDPCSYALIRPLVLDTCAWKDRTQMFPADFNDATVILKNLG